MWFAVLGLPLAWKKGLASTSLHWIGAQVCWTKDATILVVPPGQVADALERIRQIARLRLVQKRTLQSLADLLNFYSGIVPQNSKYNLLYAEATFKPMAPWNPRCML
jgi:hypothetical protein